MTNGKMAVSARRRFLLAAALIVSVVAVVAVNTSSAAEAPVGLGTASSFAILAGTGVTNTGVSTVNGDIGTCPTPAITGFPPGIVNGAQHPNDAVACQAKSDLVTAFNDAASRATTVTLANPDLANMTLLPGVYDSGTLANSGTVTLDANGDAGAVFIFRAASTLITSPNSVVMLINGAQACNVFWLVGSSATLGVGSTFVGTVMALTSITANTGAQITGRLLARNGAVTLDTNTINVPACSTAPSSTSTSTTTAGPTTSTTVAPTTTTVAPTTTTAATIPPITFPPITFPPVLGIPPIVIPPITFPPITFPTTTTTTLGATTTTSAGATTTTTSAGATTTTLAPTTTTTSATSGGGGGTTATSTTTLPGGTTPTATTLAPGTATTTPASGTSSPVGVGSATGADQASPGAAGLGANTTSASLLSPASPALGTQNLPRTGQGASGPLSVAVVSIVLGAMLLLAQRQGGVSAMASPVAAAAGYAPGSLDQRVRYTSARINAPTVTHVDRRGAQTAAGGQAPASSPEPCGLLEGLERQLQAADARLARLRAMPPWD